MYYTIGGTIYYDYDKNETIEDFMMFINALKQVKKELFTSKFKKHITTIINHMISKKAIKTSDAVGILYDIFEDE